MLPLSGSISGIGEVVASLVWADDVDKRADLSPSFFDGAWLCGAHEVLELSEELLDQVQVGAYRPAERSDGHLRPGWRAVRGAPCGCPGCRE
jgi:hypothetical protein